MKYKVTSLLVFSISFLLTPVAFSFANYESQYTSCLGGNADYAIMGEIGTPTMGDTSLSQNINAQYPMDCYSSRYTSLPSIAVSLDRQHVHIFSAGFFDPSYSFNDNLSDITLTFDYWDSYNAYTDTLDSPSDLGISDGVYSLAIQSPNFYYPDYTLPVYVKNGNYYLTDPDLYPQTSSSTEQASYHDWIYVNSVIIGLLAIPAFTRLFTIFKKKKNV